MPDNVTIVDHSGARTEEINAALLRALERIGLQCEGYAIDLAPVDTGRLKNSIAHTVVQEDKTAYIGTNVDYAPYVELGTGQYVSGGRADPWSYQDEKGNWHRTTGQQAQPFLKPALVDHMGTYKAIFEDEMRQLNNG